MSKRKGWQEKKGEIAADLAEEWTARERLPIVILNSNVEVSVHMPWSSSPFA